MLCLCPVDIYAVCGVSLNRPAYQSSVYSSGDGFQHTANLANDGYRDLTKCAITNTESKPWWTVDLGASLTVINVTVTNGVPVLFTGKKVKKSLSWIGVLIMRVLEGFKLHLSYRFAENRWKSFCLPFCTAEINAIITADVLYIRR